MSAVVLVRTGAANMASMAAGLRRAGAEVAISEAPEAVLAADRLVLPGVGALGPTRHRLERVGLGEALRERVRSGRPTFAVCLGLQLLLEGSDESPEVPGFGLFPGWAQRFSDRVRVPQMGWNQVSVVPGPGYLASGAFYFANSYRVVVPPPETRCGLAEHDGTFVAAFERGEVVACQFHPELSGAAGTGLMQRWLQGDRRC